MASTIYWTSLFFVFHPRENLGNFGVWCLVKLAVLAKMFHGNMDPLARESSCACKAILLDFLPGAGKNPTSLRVKLSIDKSGERVSAVCTQVLNKVILCFYPLKIFCENIYWMYMRHGVANRKLSERN